MQKYDVLTVLARSLATSITSLRDPFKFGPTSRVLQFASFIWSPSTVEVFATITSGGTLYIPSDEQRTNNPAKFIRDNKIDTAILTPTFLRALGRANIDTIQTISLGGEQVDQDMIDQFGGSRTLLHAYGSTETGLAIIHQVRPEDRYLTVGHAIGCRSWIVDREDHDRLIPVGEVGELVLQGWNLAREYLGEKEKTREKFITSTSWQSLLVHPGPPRFCKTNDLARYNPDGSIQVVGRKGAMIKVRGQRVDPAEVEFHLRRFLGEQDNVIVDALRPANGKGHLQMFAAVYLRDQKDLNRTGVPQLVVVTPSPEYEAILAGLRRQLEEAVPSFMVPRYIIPVNSIPRLSTGKVDRKTVQDTINKLSVQQLRGDKSSNGTKRSPITKNEFMLLTAWLSVLQLSPNVVGIEDNFFSLGGDSVFAMRLVSELRDLGMRLTVQEIFQNPTLADMALVCSHESADESGNRHLPVAEPESISALCQEVSIAYGLAASRISDVYPCTPLQEGLASLTTIRENAYVVRIVIRLDKSVDSARICRAWSKAVIRHPILRTTLVQTTKGSRQVVLNSQLTWLSATDLDSYLQRDKAVPMQCGDQFSRFCLVANTDGEHVIVWTAHHAIFDEWSMSMLLREVEEIYHDVSSDRTVDFKVFIEHLSRSNQAAAERYWIEYLEDTPATTFARVSPEYRPLVNRTLSHTIELDKTSASAVTTANLLRASWALVLSQHVGSDDLSFGATLNGRAASMPGVEKVMGPTIATVPVRIRVRRDQLISEYLSSVQNEAAATIPYEQLGLHNIRRLSAGALQACGFDTLMLLHSQEDSHVSKVLNSSVELEGWDDSFTYAFNLSCHIKDERVELHANFDSHVLHEAKIHHVLAQFGTAVISLATASPEMLVSDIDLCTTRDRNLIFDWNRNYPKPSHVSMPELLKSPLNRYSTSVAVATTEASLTYGELDVLSTRLAIHLSRNYGIGPESLVPICFEKTRWAVVAMLAIWKAGGGFVPLDPSYPSSWLDQVIRETEAQSIVCSRTQVNRFNESVATLVLPDDCFQLLESDCDDVEKSLGEILPSSCAFVLYTSGTTGKPKGIVHEHRTWASGISHRTQWLDRNHRTRIAQVSSFSFDTALEDIWSTLLFGGTVCIPTEAEWTHDLVGYMNTLRITSASLTPSLAEALGVPSRLPYLEALDLGGEPMTKKLIETWSHHVRLTNSYGPTEVAFMSNATWPLNEHSDPSNVGPSFACLTWITTIEDHDRLAPFGAVGELLIEGPTLARGYLKREAETRAKFIDNPLWLPSSQFGYRRLYKTGDLARFCEDGTIVFIGRKDTQVKIRGQRVELIHVENSLHVCFPSATAVVVELVFYADGNLHGNLTAFISFSDLHSGAEARSRIENSLDAVMKQLSAMLPQYMLPSVFIPLVATERTVTGKVDRKKLHELARALPRTQRLSASASSNGSRVKCKPVTTMELRMCMLWQTVLGVESASIRSDDNFIQLGGDSISAMRLVAMGRHPQHRIWISGEDVLRWPRLADMAAAASDLDEGEMTVITPLSLLPSSNENVPGHLLLEAGKDCDVLPEAVEDIYPCTPLQEEIMALSVKNPGTYVSQHVYRLPSDVDIEIFKTAWETVFSATPVLRTRIVQSSSILLQIVIKEPITWISTDDITRYLQQDRQSPMGLGRILGRYATLWCQDRHYFVWTQHHAVYDGWSMELTLAAVEEVYMRGHYTRRPAFNVFINHILRTDVQSDRDYWANELAGRGRPSFFPSLPSVAYQPKPNTNREFTRALPGRIPSYTTLPDLIWAAWALTTGAYTDGEDVIFGATLTGRMSSLQAVESIVGPTFTSVPLRIHISPNDTIGTLLQHVATKRVGMLPHEHFGLHNIQKINKETEAACQFQNIVILQSGQRHTQTDSMFSSFTAEGDLSDFNVYALMVQLFMEDNQIVISASFDSSVISETQTERLFGQFEQLVDQLSTRPRMSSIRDIDRISTDDRKQILSWNRSAYATPEYCIHDKIEEMATREPFAEAVAAWDGNLNYTELLTLSKSLGQKLLELKVQPEVTVALAFEKSKLAVVAALAVLQAGGSFVFLNPLHPHARLRTIVQESGADIILTSENIAAKIQSLAPHVVLISESYLTGLKTSLEPIRLTDVRPEHKACIVFTSGSTGRPKGIILQHSTICASLEAHADVVNINSHSRVLQFADFVFDMALYEIFSTLMSGGCVCLPSEHERVNDLVSNLIRFEINWAFFTPSTVVLFQPSDVPGLRTLVVGGEPMKQEIVDMWAERLDLIQCSAPAETTVCMFQKMQSDTPRYHLGRAVGGIAWIVDPDNHHVLAPIGTVGELVIDGPVVARGYINKDDMKTGGFIKAPDWAAINGLSTTNRRNIFKCGDLVHYADNGTLKFVARKDAQVKLRGQRVEVSEVEHHLQTQLLAEDVAVIVIGEISRSTLVAFLAPKGSRIGDEAVLDSSRLAWIRSTGPNVQAYLSGLLPGFMVPNFIIPLTHMPLNGSGKVDRRTLHSIGSSLSQYDLTLLGSQPVAKNQPSTTAQLKLQSLWAACLNIDRDTIGINDSFLAMGGDSVLAMRLVGLARKEGLHFSVADVFQTPRLTELAAIIRVEDPYEPGHFNAPFSMLPHPSVEQIRQQTAKQCGVQPEQIEDIYPCTALQEGLVALSIKHTNAYMAQQVFRVPPTTDIDRLRVSFEKTAQVLPILRTRFVQLSDGRLLQTVLTDDFTWLRRDGLAEYLREDAALPVELGAAFMRMAIVKDDDGVDYIAWTLHHALYDGLCLPKMMDLVISAYNDPGSLATLDQAILQYSRFVGYLRAIEGKDCVSFWSSRLANATPTAFPPIAPIRYVVKPDSSMERSVQVSRTSRSEITMASILIASWAVLLSRNTDNNDVVFGLTVSGRNQSFAGIESLLGPTMATVPFRVHIDPTRTALDLAQTVQGHAIEMIPWQHFGLQNIKKISPEVYSACDFQTLLVIQPSGLTENHILQYQPKDENSTFRTYPLTLIAELSDTSITLSAKYDSNIIPDEQMRRLLGHYEEVFRNFSREEDIPRLSEIAMITAEDRSEIWEWNKALPPRVDDCVHKLIETRVAARPDAPAVCSWDGNFTYAELDLAASNLSDRLITLGVQCGSTVPLCFEKSKWTQVAVLGVLKAGAAFFLLDPQHSQIRLRAMVERTGASIILCSYKTASIAESILGKTLVVSNGTTGSFGRKKSWRWQETNSKSSAYLISTSGTTGTPKISVIEHGAYCTSARGHIPKIHIGQDSRVLQFASYAFDTCIEDILTTLIVGGCICVPSEEDRLVNIGGAIAALEANWAHLTPSVSNLIDPSSVPSLKFLALGGEALTATHVDRWSKVLNLTNVYGPSECCVTSSVHDEAFGNLPASTIGRAVGCVAWVVDPNDRQKLAAIGTVGELLIEGHNLAREYLGEPEKTSAAFVCLPDWISEFECFGRMRSRAYMTGDLVRYDKDGRLIYVGRKDSQVKVRGQRIELGEIEHQIKRILAHESVDVAVDVQGDSTFSLAAFVGLRLHIDAQSALPLEHDGCKTRWSKIVRSLEVEMPLILPSYMIPQHYIPLSRIPLTWTRKLDRPRLKKIFADMSVDMRHEYQVGRTKIPARQPSTEQELLLRSIWSKVLNKPSVAIDVETSFISLGGDSISAMQVLAHCRQAGFRTSLIDFLMLDTIAKISERLVRMDTEPLVSASNNTDSTDFPEIFKLSPMQSKHFERYPEGNNNYQISFLVETRHQITVEALKNALGSIAQEHAMLHARFHKTGSNGWMQSISTDTDTSHEVFEVIGDTDTGPGSLLTRIQSRVNSSAGPLFVTAASRRGSRTTLAISFHHLVFDLVSWRIFLGDLEQLLQGTPPHEVFRSRSSSFKDWCAYVEGLSRRDDCCANEGEATCRYWGIPTGTYRSSATQTETLVIPGQVESPRTDTTIIAALAFISLRMAVRPEIPS
jgi:amino acid adenylation domain-containing protein